MLESVVRSFSFSAAERLDALFVRVAFRGKRASRRGTSETSRERLELAADFYRRAEAEGRLFPEPEPARPERALVRSLEDGEVLDLRWESAYPHLHEGYAELLARCPANRTAHVRWFRHRRPAPAVISLHGWGSGLFAVEERAVLVKRLYRSGADVLLFTLPFHARRGLPGTGYTLKPPLFPSTNPFCTNEAAAQVVFDVRALARALRAQGTPAVAIIGESLGGHLTALCATVEPALDAAAAILPFGSIPALLWEHAEGTAARERAQERGVSFDAFSAAFRATTPLARRPVLDADRLILLAAERDRIAPVHHARTLAEHFSREAGKPVRLELFPGAHLWQAGRAPAFDALEALLARYGVLPSQQK